MSSPASPSSSPVFGEREREALYAIIRARRDMRHFIPGAKISRKLLERLLSAAHAAPSVGLMQPWRFVRIGSPAKRKQIARLVDEEISRTARLMGERRAEFERLKLEGVRECAELLAVVLAPDDGTILGRRTLPQVTEIASAACAIENMWLAARGENLGLGWVSLFDPDALARLLACPPGARPIALLCIGPVRKFYPRPMLEEEGWRQGISLAEVCFENEWPRQEEHKGHKDHQEHEDDGAGK